MTIVVDASVVVAALADSGQEGTWAERLLTLDDLAAPHLLFAEASNVLRRAAQSGDLSQDVACVARPRRPAVAPRKVISIPAVCIAGLGSPEHGECVRCLVCGAGRDNRRATCDARQAACPRARASLPVRDVSRVIEGPRFQEENMRIGASLTSAYSGVDARTGARWMIERAAAANAAGLDSLFVGDHHATGGAYYQNTAIMGRLLAGRGDRPAGCLFLLPLWNPVLVTTVGTLASIQKGRFILQCALGAGRGQFSAMGANIKNRPSAFEESLSMVRALLAGETVSGSRRFASIVEARIDPRPPEPVEVWIGGSAEASIDRAARLGDGWLAGPELSSEAADRWVKFYLDRCEAYGRPPSAVAIRRDVFVAESDVEAEEKAGKLAAGGYRGFPPDALTWGSPETVAGKFAALGSLGYTDIIVRQMSVPQEDAVASYHRLARVKELLDGG